MKILEGREEEYKAQFAKCKDFYERSCFTYAEKWAEMLENEIETSTDDAKKVIEDNAARLGMKADTMGITGNIYGCAVNVLAQYWEYGDYLRCWHNKKFNYAGEGVVDPAVLLVRNHRVGSFIKRWRKHGKETGRFHRRNN